ncbi:MAG: sensor histidine kinase [Marvinbryantia sp.]
MKSSYKKLKRTILIRTGLVALLALVVGYGIVHFFIDGIFQDIFTDMMMWIFTNLNMDVDMANQMYGRIFMDNKVAFLCVGFVLLFLLFYNILIKWLLHYLENVEKAIDSVRDDKEEPVRMAKELQPISDKLNSLKRTLKRKERARLESEQKKNDLVVYLAHDLKTPLTSVIAYLTMLDAQKDMPEEDRTKYTHISLEKAQRLGELINEFFEITRFNLQDIVLEKEKLDVSLMLEQLADESYGVLAEKYMTCRVNTDENLLVDGDPDKLARVFDNLLRNAVAYSFTDTEIDIQAHQEENMIVVTFRNEGHQIPEQKLKSIFEKFYRADNARSSKTGGAGLGLSIAKQIVELHGGTIEAASERQFTTFTVKLPSLLLTEAQKRGRNSKKK